MPGRRRRGGECLEIVRWSVGLDLGEGGGRPHDCIAARPASGRVRGRDEVGDEGVKAERPAVTAGAVAAAFPEDVDELGHRTSFRSSAVTKESDEHFRNESVPAVGPAAHGFPLAGA